MVAAKIAANEEDRNIEWWDGRKSTFSIFKKNVIGMVSKPSDDISWITDLAKVIFAKLILIQAECKASGTAFSEKIQDHEESLSVWATHLASRDGGRMTAAMEVVKVHIYKETFGANFTNHTKAGFSDATRYSEAQEIAVEKYLSAKCKLFLRKIAHAVFPAGSKKDMTSMHKEFLRSILETAELEDFLEGREAKDIGQWMAKPQLMPAVVAWVKILWRYEGLHETLDGNLLADINDIVTLGTGSTKEPIQQVNKLELLFAPAIKTFNTAEELCNHLRVCVLTSIIRDSAKGTLNAFKVWTLAKNTVISTTRMNTPVTMNIVTNAISLAQKHLDKMEEEDYTFLRC
mmetsp:Transcript_31981/g.66183  ORF Transcript_31981/g.66183 Transcript_31981/m.66183 type:complete len:346 (-) Transcript_31981:459-1496(-)